MFTISLSTTSTAVLAALLGGLLVSCGKTEPEKSKVEETGAAEPLNSNTARLDAELLAALAPAPGDPEPPARETLEEDALRVMRLYPDKNAQDLLNVPEVNPKLAEALKGLAADPQLQAAINKSVDLAAYFKGLEGPPGTFKLNLDVKEYDDSRTQRMLTAVMTGQPKPVVQFLIDELGEASFEFNFTDSEKTSNGISLERNPAAPAADTTPPAEPD